MAVEAGQQQVAPPDVESPRRPVEGQAGEEQLGSLEPQATGVLTPANLALAIGLGVLVVWAYLPTFRRLVSVWWSDPQYSHGFLVPLFAAALCWYRRDRVRWDLVRPSWLGVPVLVLGLGLRLFGSYFYMEWFEHLSLLPVVLGLVLAVGGWELAKAWWPGVLFLIFMIPFPYRFEVALSDPLQKIATRASTYILQTLGEPAVAEGNTILVNDTRLEVVQACNGLRMAVSFVALAVAVVMVVNRPIWERLLILASALPIALVSNIVRISVTGLLSNHIDAEVAHVFFHDVAGWLMMPFALGLLWGELALINWILVEEEVPERVRVRPSAAGTGDRPKPSASRETDGNTAGPRAESGSAGSPGRSGKKKPRKKGARRRR